MLSYSSLNKLAGIGLIILLVGIGLYAFYWSNGNTSNPPGSSGFYFVIEPNYEDRVSNINYLVEIDLIKNDISLEARFVVNGTEETDYNLVIFTPYKISSLDEIESSASAVQISWELMNCRDGSIIVANVSLFGNEYEAIESKINLNVENSIVLRNFGSYILDLPFGTLPSEEITKKFQDTYSIGFSEHKYYMLLRIVLPKTMRFAQGSEELHQIRYAENAKTVEFNINEARPFLFIYENLAEISKLQFFASLAGILIGAGVSSLASEIGLRAGSRLIRHFRHNNGQ